MTAATRNCKHPSHLLGKFLSISLKPHFLREKYIGLNPSDAGPRLCPPLYVNVDTPHGPGSTAALQIYAPSATGMCTVLSLPIPATPHSTTPPKPFTLPSRCASFPPANTCDSLLFCDTSPLPIPSDTLFALIPLERHPCWWLA